MGDKVAVKDVLPSTVVRNVENTSTGVSFLDGKVSSQLIQNMPDKNESNIILWVLFTD